MSEEKSLAQIARDAFLATTTHSAQDMYARVAAAVQVEVLRRPNKSEVEPVAGQELTFVQVAQWVEKHGSTNGLQLLDANGEWRDDYVSVICACVKYRVAPKKVNDPDDPTTWEKGVAIFCRDEEEDAWILDVFGSYSNGYNYKYYSERNAYKYAKLATPEQVKAWELINGDL